MGVLALLSMAGQWVRYRTEHGSLFGLIDKFYLDHENNVPTYFAGLLLLLTAGLLGVIAFVKRQQADPYRQHWQGLAVVFALLSLDEIASFHEILINEINRVIPLSGIFYFAWVIPGLAFVGLLGLAYVRFLWHLPPTTRLRMVLSALLYVSGALLLEMVGSEYFTRHGAFNLTYSLLITVEEVLEMSGLILFIHTLLRYPILRLKGIALVYDREASRVESQPHR